MADILSQTEIDALLSALSTGEVQAEAIKEESKQSRIKPYDFRRPDKFAKEQLRTIHMVHDTYARILTSSLSTYLRTMVSVDVAGVEQLTYEEFIRSLPNPSVTLICTASPLKGNIVMELDPIVGFAIIERLLGGSGDKASPARELTDIEQTVLVRMLQRFFEGLKDAWHNVVQFNPAFEYLEMNPQFVQVAPPGDIVVLTTFKVSIGEIEGLLNLCIPYGVIEPVLPKLTARHWFAGLPEGQSKEGVAALRKWVRETTVEVAVLVGTTQITIGELIGLTKDDLILLPTHVDGEFAVQIGHNIKFFGRPGLVGKNMALQITGVCPDAIEQGGQRNE